MSKITNALILLELLDSGKKYSLKELSTELGVSERMVRYYKEQLELAGIMIESYKGPNGGYFINKKNQFKISYFNKYDLKLLENVLNTVDDKLDNKLINDYKSLLSRLRAIYEVNKKVSEYDEVDVTVYNSDEKIRLINDALKLQQKITILYQNVDGTYTKRDISPITFFKFEDVLYVTAFCHLRGDIRHFEINRIIEIEK